MRFQVSRCALLAPLIAISTSVLAEESITIPLTREDLVRSCEVAQQQLATVRDAYAIAVANSSEADRRILAMQADLNRIQHSLVTSLQMEEIRSRYGVPSTDTVERYLTHAIYNARQDAGARSYDLAAQFIDLSGQQAACQQQCGATIELANRIEQGSPRRRAAVHAVLSPNQILARVGSTVAEKCPVTQANSGNYSYSEMQSLMANRPVASGDNLVGTVLVPILRNDDENWLSNIFSFSSTNLETCTGLSGEALERCRARPRINFQGIRGSAIRSALASAIPGGDSSPENDNWFQRVATCASWNVEFQRDDAEVVSGVRYPEDYEITVTLTWRTYSAILEPLTGHCVSR